MQTTPPPLRTSRLGDTIALNEDGTTGFPALGTARVATGTAPVDPSVSIGVKMAAKLAVAECLMRLVAWEVDGPRVAEAADLGDAPPTGARIELRSNSIFIDWPEPSSEHAPLKLTVRDGDEGYVYEDLGLTGPDMLEESHNKFSPGTVLLHEHDVRGTVVIEATLATGNARDAVELALSRIFGVEPSDFRTGRRVVSKAYYDQDVRITLARIPFSGGDRPESIQSNEYPLFCTLEVELANVRLVKSPGLMNTGIDTSDMPATD